jgi:hypothetical protein
MARAFRLIESDGNEVTLLSSEAFPPGAPIDVPIEGEALRVKVRSCKRSDEAPELPFRILGRFQNLTRAQRERVSKRS